MAHTSKFAIIATCKEVEGASGSSVMSEGTRCVVVNDEWVRGGTSLLWGDEPLPKTTKLFDSREEAEAFARDLDSPKAKARTDWWMTWHPWYVQPKSWEVVELEPVLAPVAWRAV